MVIVLASKLCALYSIKLIFITRELQIGKYKIPHNFKQVAQKAVDLERYKTREDKLRVEDSIKEGVIISLKEENKTFALKLAEIQEKETRSSNEVGSNSSLILS